MEEQKTSWWSRNQWRVAFISAVCAFVALTFYLTTNTPPISSGFPAVEADCTEVADTGKTDTAKQ